MLSNRPYLLRAFYQWIIDNSCTPILVIDANHPQAKIPKDYVDGGEIVFNISSTAVRDMKFTNDHVEFKASFSGVIHIISAPIQAVLAVYAEENGEGIFFDAGEDEDETSSGSGKSSPIQLASVESSALHLKKQESAPIEMIPQPNKGKPTLRLIE